MLPSGYLGHGEGLTPRQPVCRGKLQGLVPEMSPGAPWEAQSSDPLGSSLYLTCSQGRFFEITSGFLGAHLFLLFASPSLLLINVQ